MQSYFFFLKMLAITNNNDKSYSLDQLLCTSNAFSKVYLGYATNIHSKGSKSKNHRTGPFAIKIIDKHWKQDELDILMDIKDINGVVSIKDYFTFGQVGAISHVIVTDYYNGVDLYSFIENGIVEDIAKYIFKQLCKTMNTIHQMGIIHRDLKPENIIILKETFDPIILDWGLAFKPSETPHRISCGSAMYASPEVIGGHHYRGPEIDVWSLGVILYVMLTGMMPYSESEYTNINKLFIQISKCDIYYNHPELTVEIKSLLKRIFTKKNRATLTEILENKWLA
jgi:serine/threonine protein kinase